MEFKKDIFVFADKDSEIIENKIDNSKPEIINHIENEIDCLIENEFDY